MLRTMTTLGLLAALAAPLPLFAQDEAAPAAAPAPGSAPADEAAPAPGAEPAPLPEGLKEESQQVGYALGLDIGSSLKAQQVEVDTDAFLAGLKDALAGAEPKLSREQMMTAMMSVQAKVQQRQQQQMKDLSATNAAEGKAFRDQNAAKEGVSTTASGLQIETLKEGTGAQPTAEDTVTVHYTGKLVNGDVFDSSEQRGEPATFTLSDVVPGWREGVALMKVGGKSRLVLPPELAYGERGAGNRIPPNATLIFDVELLDVKKAE